MSGPSTVPQTQPSFSPNPLSYPIPTSAEMLHQQVTAQPDIWFSRVNDLVSRLADTLAEAYTAQEFVIRQRAEISELKLANAELRIEGLSQSRAARSEKTPDVDRFDGTRDKLPTFVAECRVKFAENADRYPTQESRINYVFTRCAGAAKDQLLPFWESDTVAQLAPFNDTDSLLSWLQVCFGDPDPKGTAQSKISHLLMTNREFSQYLADFNKHIERTGWNAEAQKSALMSGLSNELRNLLIHHDTEEMGLRELTSLCMRLDNKIRATRQANSLSTRFGIGYDSKSTYPRTPKVASITSAPIATGKTLVDRSVSTPANGANATPIIAHTTTQGGNLMDLSRNRGPLTPEEKQRRRSQGLCLYCGGTGHIASNCPNRGLKIREIGNPVTDEEDSGKE